MSQLRLASILRSTFNYLGEGNSNVVLSFPDSGQILRLRKSETCAEYKTVLSQDEYKMLQLESLFYQNILRPLLGEKFIHIPEILQLDLDEVDILNDLLSSCRPAARQGKQLKCRYGMASLDYTSDRIFRSPASPTLCVELKCKQGWMPEIFEPYKKCMFCLNQYWKLRKGSISALSNYCPLDMFSGNRTRMQRAIVELIKNPQNNLKIFLNGRIIYGENQQEIDLDVILKEYYKSCGVCVEDPIEVFINTLIDVLTWTETECLEDSESSSSSLNSEEVLQDLCCSPEDGLPAGCILHKIVELQTLERGHILEADDSYSDYDYLRDLLSASNPRSSVAVHSLSPLQKYMLACSAKDCSVMITLKAVNTFVNNVGDIIVVKNDDHYFLANVGIVDFDPKPASKIKYHRKRDEEAIQSYLSFTKR